MLYYRSACLVAGYRTFFTDPVGITYIPCKDKAIYTGGNALSGNEVKYPVSQGLFDGGGLTGCMFGLSASKHVECWEHELRRSSWGVHQGSKWNIRL